MLLISSQIIPIIRKIIVANHQGSADHRLRYTALRGDLIKNCLSFNSKYKMKSEINEINDMELSRNTIQ